MVMLRQAVESSADSLEMSIDLGNGYNPGAFTSTVTTDEAGESHEQKVYNGTTEDLLSIIKDLRARVAALESAAARFRIPLTPTTQHHVRSSPPQKLQKAERSPNTG